MSSGRKRSAAGSSMNLSRPLRQHGEQVQEATASTSSTSPTGRASVSRSPEGSVRPAAQRVTVMMTSGDTPHWAKSVKRLLCVEMENIEAMDMSDEETADSSSSSPWNEQACASDWGKQECPKPDPLLLNTSTEAHIKNDPDFPNVTSVEDSIRPSMSGMTATLNPVVKLEVNAGSDLDSDVEIDIASIQDIVFVGGGRDILDEDEIEEPVREAINTLQSAMDEEVERLLGESNVYTWEEGFETFRGRPETFTGPTPGPLKDYDTAYDAFTDIWSKDIVELIVHETNRYAKQTIDNLKASGNLKESSRLHQWVDTDVDEMMTLLAVYMFMGMSVRTSQEEYWRTDTVLELPKFRRLMSYNRYVLLSKFLHFIDDSDVSQNLTSNEGVALSSKLAKLAPVISHLNQKFSSLYNLQDKIALDESLTLFQGRLSWAQTIRSNDARFGIKSFELCESRTGYMYRFQIYAGKNSEGTSSADALLSADLGSKSAHILLDLLKHLEHRGHCVAMDNFYNSPALARYLKSLGFDCLGTLRTNRKNVPCDIAKIPDVPRGTIIARHCGDVSIIAWKHSKVVPIISTYHDAETCAETRAGEVIVKPVCVRDYNNAMGGVDLKDQKLSMHLLERKQGEKWYTRMFKRLLNTSIHNAFVLYVSSLRRRNMSPMKYRQFRFDLGNSVADKHRACQLEIPAQIDDSVMRLRRDVVHVPNYAAGSKNRKRCGVCYRHGKSKMVHTFCVTCNEYLCFENCWAEWHSSTTLKEERSRVR